MMRALVCSFVVACLAAVTTSQAKAAGPLDDLIAPVDGKSACFVRAYDAKHLRSHPRQKTVSMIVWLSYESAGSSVPGLNVALGLAQRGSPAMLFSSGSCEFNAKANRDTSGNRLIKAYPKESGHVCLQSARPDVFLAVSAEEGGALIMDRGKDRDTLMLYLDERLTMVNRPDRNDLLDIKFGADDRVFMLRRAPIKDCAAVEEAVTIPRRNRVSGAGVGLASERPSRAPCSGFAPRGGAASPALTPHNAAIRVRRTNSGPGFWG
jgi:hypothetical protein